MIPFAFAVFIANGSLHLKLRLEAKRGKIVLSVIHTKVLSDIFQKIEHRGRTRYCLQKSFDPFLKKNLHPTTNHWRWCQKKKHSKQRNPEMVKRYEEKREKTLNGEIRFKKNVNVDRKIRLTVYNEKLFLIYTDIRSYTLNCAYV